MHGYESSGLGRQSLCISGAGGRCSSELSTAESAAASARCHDCTTAHGSVLSVENPVILAAAPVMNFWEESVASTSTDWVITAHGCPGLHVSPTVREACTALSEGNLQADAERFRALGWEAQAHADVGRRRLTPMC